jgi:phosphatidate cytidylyltransferase
MIGVGCGAALITATFWRIGPDAAHVASSYRWEQLVLIGSLIAVFIRQFPQKHNDQPLTTMACTLLGIWYVPLLFNFLTRLAFIWEESDWMDPVGPTGRLVFLYLIAVVKSGDMGAYLVGMALGRHKLLPRISPAKTWEGLAGGLAFAVSCSLVFSGCAGWRLGVVPLGPAHALALGLLLGGAGALGDLFESLVKRASGVKDSGTLVPGMGGLLDVLDSLLFGAPALYVYARMVLV